MRGRVESGDAGDVVDGALLGLEQKRRAKRHSRGTAVWLREETHGAVRLAAARAGVSMSGYIENAIAELRTPLPASARIAAPLASVGYRLAQIALALESGDLVSAQSDLVAARNIVADALRPLAREHTTETRQRVRPGDDWSG